MVELSTQNKSGMRLSWGHDDGAFFFSRPDAAQQECCEPGFTLLCMGLFSQFFVQALPCTAVCLGICAASSARPLREIGMILSHDVEHCYLGEIRLSHRPGNQRVTCITDGSILAATSLWPSGVK